MIPALTVKAVKAPASISQFCREAEERMRARSYCAAPPAVTTIAATLQGRAAMPKFYRPPLDGAEEDPFARDGNDKLIRRSYWLDLSDRSLILMMTQGLGARLTPEEKRAHLEDIGRERLIDRILAPEIIPPGR
jgi:hypothetical protein